MSKPGHNSMFCRKISAFSMITFKLFPLVFSLLSAVGSTHGETCIKTSYGSFGSSEILYCSNGCCGSIEDRYCCTPGGEVAGIIVGSLIGCAIVVAIIFLCIRCLTHKNVMVTPAAATVAMVTVTSNGTHSTMYPTHTYPAGVYVPAPPPYANNVATPPPPAYSATNNPSATTYNQAHTYSSGRK